MRLFAGARFQRTHPLLIIFCLGEFFNKTDCVERMSVFNRLLVCKCVMAPKSSNMISRSFATRFGSNRAIKGLYGGKVSCQSAARHPFPFICTLLASGHRVRQQGEPFRTKVSKVVEAERAEHTPVVRESSTTCTIQRHYPCSSVH
jgi:hypothetical protein